MKGLMGHTLWLIYISNIFTRLSYLKDPNYLESKAE